jgi:hypothetical protein
LVQAAGRVLRGGSWYDWARNCRSAFRFAYAPGYAWYVSGLRLSAGQERAQSGTSCASQPGVLVTAGNALVFTIANVCRNGTSPAD